MTSVPHEDSQGFSQRLREAMQGRSIREFASSASMSAGTLHNYLNDESLPTLDKLIALANTSDVSLNWLATGRGPRQRSMTSDEYAGGSAFISSSASGSRSQGLNVALLKAVLECLEQTEERMQKNLSAQKKSSVAVSIYDVFSELDEPAINREKVNRLIEAMIG